MNTMPLKTLSVLSAGATALLLNTQPASADDSGKFRVDFAKCFPTTPVDAPPGTVFVNVGKVKGAVTGDLVVFGQPGSFDRVEGRFYLEADYEVTATDGSSRSFTARVGGRMNDDGTRRAILYGYVSQGWLRGARVVDEFVGTTAECVKGTLTITPKWASLHEGDED